MEALLHLVAQHFALMETMTTRDYLAFRDKLNPASGFQSAQLREIEILLGLPDAERIPLGHEHTYLDALKDGGKETAASRRVAARLADRPSLGEAIREWLYRTPIQGSLPGQPGDEERVRAFIDAYCATHARRARHAGWRSRRRARSPRPTSSGSRQRYEKEIAAARAFLLAEDVAGEGARAGVAGPRGARLHRELPRAAAPRLAARGHRRDRRVRAGVRHLPPAPRAHGRAGDRSPHRDRRLVGRRLPRSDRAQVPRLPRRLGGPDHPRPEVGASRARERRASTASQG